MVFTILRGWLPYSNDQKTYSKANARMVQGSNGKNMEAWFSKCIVPTLSHTWDGHDWDFQYINLLWIHSINSDIVMSIIPNGYPKRKKLYP